MRRFTYMLLCAVLLAGFPANVYGSLSELEQEKNEANQQLQNTKNQQEFIQSEIARVDREMQQLDDALVKASDELDVVNKSLEDTKARQEQSARELTEAQAERDRQFEMFKDRLRVMYEYGEASYLEVLFQAASIRDFLTRLEVFNNIAKSDQEMVTRLESAEALYAQKVEDDAKIRNLMEDLQFSYEAAIKEYDEALANQKTYIDQLYIDDANYAILVAMEEENARVAYNAWKAADDAEKARIAAEKAAAEEARRNAPITYNGIMQWPAPSFIKITDRYGWRNHPVYKRDEFHKGVDIASRSGTDIIAADGGQVILAARNGSYGNCVIIDHGGGISTLYAHASKIHVSVGQTVSKGSVIASIGSTGVSTGPHLHFEVHRNGEHTDPKAYLGY
jgi:murein DD-endopeptidase MepM/ murein hydrolase activator NlpD